MDPHSDLAVESAVVGEVEGEVGIFAATITKPNQYQEVVVAWMIAEFIEDTVNTANPKQFVSIDKNDVQGDPDLAKAGKHLGDDFPSRCNIDNQDPVIIGKKPKQTVYVNIQPQIGLNKRRVSFAHVNVIEKKKVGRALIRQALTQSMGDSKTRWIVEDGKGGYVITKDSPRA